MNYTFRPITEEDFDRVTDLPEIQTWLTEQHLEKEYYDFELEDNIVEYIEKRVSLIIFRCDRWWEENIYLLRIENQFCFFSLDEKNKVFPNFKVIYWGLNSFRNKEVECLFEKTIREIFSQGNRFLTGQVDKLDSYLINNFKF